MKKIFSYIALLWNNFIKLFKGKNMNIKTDIEQIIKDFCSQRQHVINIIFAINETREDTSIGFTIYFLDNNIAEVKVLPSKNDLEINSKIKSNHQSNFSKKDIAYEQADFIEKVETTIKEYYIQKNIIVRT